MSKDGSKQQKEVSEINDIINKIQEVEKQLEADDDDDDQNHPMPFLIWTAKMGWEEIAHAKQQATNKLEQLKSRLMEQGNKRKAIIENHQKLREEIQQPRKRMRNPVANMMFHMQQQKALARRRRRRVQQKLRHPSARDADT